jgi:hypothetical protein
MAEPHLDHPGEIHWFKSERPLPVLGRCPHSGCGHHGQGVIAWGPSLKQYELVECGSRRASDGCAGSCRAWSDGQGRITSDWLHVDLDAAPVGTPA